MVEARYKSVMRVLNLAIAAVAIVGASCTSLPGPQKSPQTATPASHATKLPGGCQGTQVLRGSPPAWLVQAAGAAAAPRGLPYVISSDELAGGFIFGYPLRAGHPDDRANKILWAVRNPRERHPLVLTGQPLDNSGPPVEVTQPSNSSPGEIYPSIVDVPSPGCWRFELRWGNNRTEVSLDYAAA
jgi:hypothetical protein